MLPNCYKNFYWQNVPRFHFPTSVICSSNSQRHICHSIPQSSQMQHGYNKAAFISFWDCMCWWLLSSSITGLVPLPKHSSLYCFLISHPIIFPSSSTLTRPLILASSGITMLLHQYDSNIVCCLCLKLCTPPPARNTASEWQLRVGPIACFSAYFITNTTCL